MWKWFGVAFLFVVLGAGCTAFFGEPAGEDFDGDGKKGEKGLLHGAEDVAKAAGEAGVPWAGPIGIGIGMLIGVVNGLRSKKKSKKELKALFNEFKADAKDMANEEEVKDYLEKKAKHYPILKEVVALYDKEKAKEKLKAP